MISLTHRPSTNLISSNFKVCSESNLALLFLLNHPRPTYFHLLLSLLSTGLSASVLVRSDSVKTNQFMLFFHLKSYIMSSHSIHSEKSNHFNILQGSIGFFTYQVSDFILFLPFLLRSHWTLLFFNHVSLLLHQYSLYLLFPHGSLSHLLQVLFKCHLLSQPFLIILFIHTIFHLPCLKLSILSL